jgi:hypothetical protein
MTEPTIIEEVSFQDAWIKAVQHLSANHWDYYNLVVHIKDPQAIDVTKDESVTNFSRQIHIRTPKDVAYTIFPYRLYSGNGTELYDLYNNRFYPWTRKREHSGWGTYFHRMINYQPDKRYPGINQLKNIIDAINRRTNTLCAAYTISITYPGGETIRPLGGPCLNNILIQMLPSDQPKLGLLAVYRNHEFLERAYGNYYGLCKLLSFLNEQTDTIPGTITCISSHAYVIGYKTKLTQFISTVI